VPSAGGFWPGKPRTGRTSGRPAGSAHRARSGQNGDSRSDGAGPTGPVRRGPGPTGSWTAARQPTAGAAGPRMDGTQDREAGRRGQRIRRRTRSGAERRAQARAVRADGRRHRTGRPRNARDGRSRQAGGRRAARGHRGASPAGQHQDAASRGAYWPGRDAAGAGGQLLVRALGRPHWRCRNWRAAEL